MERADDKMMIQTDTVFDNPVKLPDIYWEEANKPMEVSRVEIYTLNPIRVDRPFFDATAGPFPYIAYSCWLVLWDENNIMGQVPCSKYMADMVLPFIKEGGRKTPLQWYQDLYWKLRNFGFASTAFVELGRFDMAMHDIMAKRAGLPLHRFLGAKRDWVKVYASGFSADIMEKEELIAEAEKLLKDGYTCFKVKSAGNFGTHIEEDVKRLEYIQKLLGEDASIAVDVNQLWNAKHALEFIKRIEHLNIAWYEEPVHSYDIQELEKLTAECPVPISMGESMRNRYQFYPYIKAGVSHLQPIPDNLCGVREWVSVRDQALEAGLTLSSGGFSHQTADYIATAREEDMVEYLYPLMNKLYYMMDVKPVEKDGMFLLSNEIGSGTRPDFAAWEKLGYVANKEIFKPGK